MDVSKPGCFFLRFCPALPMTQTAAGTISFSKPDYAKLPLSGRTHEPLVLTILPWHSSSGHCLAEQHCSAR